MLCANCGASVSDSASSCPQCGKAIGGVAAHYAPPRSPVSDRVGIDDPRIYAGFWRRVLAHLIDYVLLVSVLAFVAYMMRSSAPRPSNAALFWLSYLLLPLIYFVVFESLDLQGTLGKKLVGIKVTDMAGQKISVLRALGRYLGKLVSGFTLVIGFAMAGFTAKRQALHDMMGGCLVVKAQTAPATIAEAPGSPRGGGYIAIMILLIVLFGPASIGILAAIAIPAYQNYTIRAQLTEGLVLADGWKTQVAEYHASTGKWPDTKDLKGAIELGKYEKNIEVVNGAIVITYGGQANIKLANKVLVLSPAANQANDIYWVCGSSQVPDGLEPTVDPSKYTTVGRLYLPASCHS